VHLKILIVDSLSKKTVTELEKLGAKVEVNTDLKAETLPSAIGDAEVLVVRSTKVSAATIDAGSSLSLIIRAGAGVNTIDLAAANKRGIQVANCPGKNTDAVAELAIGLLIAADRRIANATSDLRGGKWKKSEYGKARGLKGRTLGIIGLGDIGNAVAKRAKGLDMNVVAWSRSLTADKAKALGLGYCASLNELAAQSDAVSVHLAAAAETNGLLDSDFFQKMKDGAIFINTSRGEIVKTPDLKEAIRSKGLRVGLDVFENEPAGGSADFADKELAELGSCTPHIGASTDQASEAIADEVVRIVAVYKDTGKAENMVNIKTKSSGLFKLVVRHYNRVGVLASVLDELRNENVNIEEMDNAIFMGGAAAVCSLTLDSKPSASLVDRINANPDIIKSSLN